MKHITELRTKKGRKGGIGEVRVVSKTYVGAANQRGLFVFLNTTKTLMREKQVPKLLKWQVLWTAMFFRKKKEPSAAHLSLSTPGDFLHRYPSDY